MTQEAFERAKQILVEIKRHEEAVTKIENALQCAPTDWRMEIRRSTASPYMVIDHHGILPEFLNKILKKECEILDALKKEFAEL